MAAGACLAACTYNPGFADCTIRCDQTCPVGFFCHSDGYCHRGQPGDAVVACVSQPDAAADAPELIDAIADGLAARDGQPPDGGGAYPPSLLCQPAGGGSGANATYQLSLTVGQPVAGVSAGPSARVEWGLAPVTQVP